MRPSDVRRIGEMERELFDNPWSPGIFLIEIQNRNVAHPYVLLQGKTIIGYTVVWKIDREIHIGNIAVDKKYQRKGYGTFLMQKIFDTFQDYEVIYLEVRATNKPAISLYEKFGFGTLYRRKHYYPDGEDALVMARYRERKL